MNAAMRSGEYADRTTRVNGSRILSSGPSRSNAGASAGRGPTSKQGADNGGVPGGAPSGAWFPGDMLLVGEIAASSPLPEDWQPLLADRLRDQFDASAALLCEIDWIGPSDSEATTPYGRAVLSRDSGAKASPFRLDIRGLVCDPAIRRFALTARPARPKSRTRADGEVEPFIAVELLENRLHGMIHFGARRPGVLAALDCGRGELNFSMQDRDRFEVMLQSLKPLLLKRLYFARGVRALTPRGVDVLACAMRGFSEKQIADELSVTRHTVHQYMKKIYVAFDVGTRSELLASVIPQGRAAPVK